MESSRNTDTVEASLKRQRNEHVRRLNQIEVKKSSLMTNHKHHHHHRKKSRPRQQEIHAERGDHVKQVAHQDVNEWGERVQTIELELKDTTHGQCRKRSLRRNRSEDAGIDVYRNQDGIGRTHSRCDLYLTLAAAYLVLICSIAPTTNKDYSRARSSSRTAVLILSSLSFVLTFTLGIRCIYKSARGNITTRKPPRRFTLEHMTTPIISMFTYIASGMILYPRYNDVILAEEVWNANLFYSSYICLYGSTYLMVKVFVQNDTIASALSSIKILLSMALFTSMCNTIAIMVIKHGPACYGYLDQLPYCSHAAAAEVLGVWCIFMSLLLCVATGCLELYHFSSTSRRETRLRRSSAGMRNLQRSRTLLYLILFGGSTLLFILHCASVATVTLSSRGSDGSAFITSWVACIISLLLWKSSIVEFMNYIHSKALPSGMNKRDASTAENEHKKSIFECSERSGITDSTFEELYSDLESPLPQIGDTFVLLPVQQKTRVEKEERLAKNSSRQRKYRKAPTNETILHVQLRPDPIERLVSEELGSGDNINQNSRRHLVAAQDDHLKSREDLSSHDSYPKVVVPREKIHTSRRNLDRVGASSYSSFAHSTSTGFVQRRSSRDNRCHHQNDQPKSTEDLSSNDSDPKSVIPREKNRSSNLERARASPLPYAYSTPISTGFVRRSSLQSFKSNLSPLHEGSLESSGRTGTTGSIKNPTPVSSPSNNLIRLSPTRNGRITKINSLRMNKDDKQLKSHIVVTRTTTPPPPPPPRRNINKNQRQGETNDKILREPSSPSPNLNDPSANQLLTKKKSKSFDCRLLSTTNTHQLQVPENHGNSIESDFIMSDIEVILSGGNSVVTALSEGTAKARESDSHTPLLMKSLLSVDVISAIHQAAVSANKKKRIDSMIKEWETSIVSTDEFLASSPLTQNSAKHQSQRRGSVDSLSSMKEALAFLHK